jgi:hypothetical protein
VEAQDRSHVLPVVESDRFRRAMALGWFAMAVVVLVEKHAMAVAVVGVDEFFYVSHLIPYEYQ